MFSLDIVDTDAFLEMPGSAQALYFHLGMRADDDGFVSSPRRITSMVNASVDDFKILVAKSFIIPFASGVCVVKDWKVNNLLRGDRYTPTRYTNELAQLEEVNREYKLINAGQSSGMTNGIPNGNQTGDKMEPQFSRGKDNIDKSMGADKPRTPARFVKPTIEDVQAYCNERKNGIDPQRFIDYYEANGWVQSRGKPIKDWRAAVRTWESNNKGSPAPKVQIIDAGYSSSDLVEYPEGSGQYIRRDAIPGGMNNAV